ncbi:unnamed protein product [Penicillium camemberti]|uniref:Str. FM013 n=1 Tax=Penicillium camemberti (strain FM 013) TaxID=1429867 RepID=A0A0G4PTN1_PENC3|nr:unnamed protein product [Penicillium camemberti]
MVFNGTRRFLPYLDQRLRSLPQQTLIVDPVSPSIEIGKRGSSMVAQKNTIIPSWSRCIHVPLSSDSRGSTPMTAFKTCRSKWKTFSRCKGKQRGCTEYLGKDLASLNQPYE